MLVKWQHSYWQPYWIFIHCAKCIKNHWYAICKHYLSDIVLDIHKKGSLKLQYYQKIGKMTPILNWLVTLPPPPTQPHGEKCGKYYFCFFGVYFTTYQNFTDYRKKAPLHFWLHYKDVHTNMVLIHLPDKRMFYTGCYNKNETRTNMAVSLFLTSIWIFLVINC